MAKKLRKPRKRIGLSGLFLIIVAPWLIMGAVAAALSYSGTNETLAVFGGLAAALATTYLAKIFVDRRTGRR